MSEQLDSANINSLWLKNIYENIKLLEQGLRLAKEGCTTINEYAQMPTNLRDFWIIDIQYKNLSICATELSLLVDDLRPIIGNDKAKEYEQSIKTVADNILDKNLLIKKNYALDGKTVIGASTTPFFNHTLDQITLIRRSIISSIGHILYMDTNTNEKETPVPRMK